MMQSKSTTAKTTACSVNSDGSVMLQGKRVAVPSVHVEEVIGNGVNGVVVKGRHRLLEVPLAVKFWMKLKERDHRDKMAQGLAEVEKLFEVENYHSVVRIRTVGEVGGILYAVMDHFDGKTLASWLESNPPLGIRRLVGLRLVDEICAFSGDSVYHGDLHTDNVLVDTREDSLLDEREPRIGIIDFGTSLYSSKNSSLARHWRVFIKTLDCLLKPFEVRRLALTPMPPPKDASAIRLWFRSSIISIRHVLIRLGADSLIDDEETHEFQKGQWPTRDEMLAAVFPLEPPILSYGKELSDMGRLKMSASWLGAGSVWWPPAKTSRYSKEVGPPWKSSLSDEAWW